MKMSKRWKNVFRLFAMQLHVESVWAEIEASRPLRVPGIGQPNLFEYSWFIPRRKRGHAEVAVCAALLTARVWWGF